MLFSAIFTLKYLIPQN